MKSIRFLFQGTVTGYVCDEAVPFSKRDRTFFVEIDQDDLYWRSFVSSEALSVLGVVLSVVTWLSWLSSTWPFPLTFKFNIAKTEKKEENNLFSTPVPFPMTDSTLSVSVKFRPLFRSGPNFHHHDHSQAQLGDLHRNGLLFSSVS